MNSFGKFMALYKKELKIFFSQPVAYALMVIFMAISGYFFAAIAGSYAEYSLRSMNSYQRSMMDINVIDGVFRPFYFNMAFVLLLLTPLLTMRMFAEEKREGTSELLFTLPVNDLSLFGAKFLSVLTVFMIMAAGSLSSFIIFRTAAGFELLPVLSGAFGLLLLASAFISVGMFVSSLTENQIVAAAVSFTVLLFFWIIDWLSGTLGPAAGKVLSSLSVIRHFDGFSKGVIDTGDIAYYAVFIFIFCFLTLRSLESKKWRG